MADSLRATIEEAFDAAESANTSKTEDGQEAKVAPAIEAQASTDAGESKVVDAEKTVAVEEKTEVAAEKAAEPEVEKVEKVEEIEPPPQSWKAPQRAKWNNLDPDIRQEITRREQEHARFIGASGQARQLASQFVEAVRPYEARIRSYGIPPVQAVERLFQADHILSSAPATQRAVFMAQMIKEYGVDIKELDSALAGDGPADPVRSQLDNILEQRLAPLNQFIQQQQFVAQQQQQQRDATIKTEIDAMAADKVKYPHFEQVRGSMADMIELLAARNQTLPLDQIYTRAVVIDPSLGAKMITGQAKEHNLAAAQAQSAQAQRAKSASQSVTSSLSGSPSTARLNGAPTVRDAIEAAWAQHTGR